MSIGFSPNQNVSSSPGNSSIPTLKSLRALLPFGPSSAKNNGSPPSAISPLNKSRFGALSDGVRRSMQRERSSDNSHFLKNRASLNIQRPGFNSSLPVISIAPRSASSSTQHVSTASQKEPEEEPRRKRSISLSGLPRPEGLAIDKPLPSPTHEPEDPAPSPIRDGSPSIPPPSDLSTIIEADTSGISISKHLPSPSPSPCLSPSADLSHSSSIEMDLNISSSELNNEVLQAMRTSDAPGARVSWLGPKPLLSLTQASPSPSIFTESDVPVDSEQFALELDLANAQATDQSLTALLSPNNFPSTSTVSPLTSTIGRAFSHRSKESSELPDIRTLSEHKQTSPPSSFQTPNNNPPPSPTPLDIRTPSASPSRDTHQVLRRGSTASTTGTAESWSPALSTVAYYARRSGGSTGSAYGATPPSPLSSNPEEPQPDHRQRRVELLNRRALGRHTGASSPEVDGNERESGDPSDRPTSAMSRITSSSRLLRTPIIGPSGRGDLDDNTISVDVGRRRSSVDTPRNSTLSRTASTIERRPSPSIDLSASTRSQSRTGFGFRRATGPGNWPSSARRRSASVDEDLPRFAQAGSTAAPTSQQNRTATRPTHEWLGPRTAKAFKAAGLLDDEKAAEASSSKGTAMSSTGASTPREFGSASTRPDSRLTRGDTNGGYFSLPHSTRHYENGRQNSSVMDHSPVRESPTFTLSSSSGLFREREPFRSASSSTAPTSVSSHTSQDRDRDLRDREVVQYRAEISMLKEKHNSESSALLGALSDSQRVARMLREENDSLREKALSAETEITKWVRRSETMALENARVQDATRWRFANVEKENERLRRDVRDLKALVGELEQALLVTNEPTSSRRPSLSEESEDSLFDDDDHTTKLPQVPQSLLDSLDTPITNGRGHTQRRLSGTSSIFPIVPSNMSMLLHDEDPSIQFLGQRSGYSDSLNGSFNGSPNPPLFQLSSHDEIPFPVQEPPSSFPSHHARSQHTKNKSIMSARSFKSSISASPSANSSFMTDMMPGSPASLQLSPEDELHLRDMESLTLDVYAESNSPAASAFGALPG